MEGWLRIVFHLDDIIKYDIFLHEISAIVEKVLVDFLPIFCLLLNFCITHYVFPIVDFNSWILCNVQYYFQHNAIMCTFGFCFVYILLCTSTTIMVYALVYSPCRKLRVCCVLTVLISASTQYTELLVGYAVMVR